MKYKTIASVIEVLKEILETTKDADKTNISFDGKYADSYELRFNSATKTWTVYMNSKQTSYYD